MTLSRQDRAALFGKRPKNEGEDQLQIAVMEHLHLRGMPGVIYFAVPNGGQRSKSEAAKLKRMGVLAGVSDIGVILPPNGQYGALELKVGDNKPSAAQDAFGVAVTDAGALFAVAWNIDQALRILESWNAIRPEVEFR